MSPSTHMLAAWYSAMRSGWSGPRSRSRLAGYRCASQAAVHVVMSAGKPGIAAMTRVAAPVLSAPHKAATATAAFRGRLERDDGGRCQEAAYGRCGAEGVGAPFAVGADSA